MQKVSHFMAEVNQVGQAWFTQAKSMLDAPCTCLLLPLPRNVPEDLNDFLWDQSLPILQIPRYSF